MAATELARRDAALEAARKETEEVRGRAAGAEALAREAEDLRAALAVARGEAAAARTERAQSVGELEEAVLRMRGQLKAAERREAEASKTARERGERAAALVAEVQRLEHANEGLHEQLQDARRENAATGARVSARKCPWQRFDRDETEEAGSEFHLLLSGIT